LLPLTLLYGHCWFHNRVKMEVLPLLNIICVKLDTISM
jgi:hypothetical protein